ncbi:MAG: hypothetical protein FD126_1095 [Elusimicrobia bacterium]|nr:MAG: hypothetical protein FD126_1095 [Elusimicrobiota bacterium]
MNALALALALLAPALPAAAQAPSMGGSGGDAAAAANASAGSATSGLSAAQADPKPRKPKKEKTQEPEVAESTGGVKILGVDDVYGGTKLRDPFMKLSGGGVVAAAAVAAPPKEFDPEEFSIHQLELKGIMRDKAGMMALLSDMNTHFTFILRGGRLYDMRKKAVPGVTGVIQLVQKTVTLTTADKDVQTLRLGEDADEAEE